EPVRTESNTGVHETPAFVDFHTPPVAVAMYTVVPRRPPRPGAVLATAISAMRPLITAGPIERKARDRTRTESGGSAPAWRCTSGRASGARWYVAGVCADAATATSDATITGTRKRIMRSGIEEEAWAPPGVVA